MTRGLQINEFVNLIISEYYLYVCLSDIVFFFPPQLGGNLVSLTLTVSQVFINCFESVIASI